MELHVGDQIQVPSSKVDRPDRHGVVRGVLDDDPLRIEVQWDDGHTSVFVPHGGNVRVEEQSG